MNKARKVLGEKRRKAHEAHGVGRWKDTEGCFVESSTLRCSSDGQSGEHQDRPTSSTGVASSPGSSSVFLAQLIFFISLHTQQALQIWRGRADWKHQSSFIAKQRCGKDPPAAGDKAESGFSCGSKKGSDLWESSGSLGTPGTCCARALQAQPGNQRGSRGSNHPLG